MIFSEIINIGIIGQKEHYKKFYTTLADICGDNMAEHIIVKPPREGVSINNLVDEALMSDLQGVETLWIVFQTPEKENDVRWPSNFILVAETVGKTVSNSVMFQGILPQIESFETICNNIAKNVLMKDKIYELEMETARLKAEKFKISKQSNILEKQLTTTGNSISNISRNWSNRVSGLKTSLFFLLTLSSCLLALFAWGVAKPESMHSGLISIREMIIEKKQAFFSKDRGVVTNISEYESETDKIRARAIQQIAEDIKNAGEISNSNVVVTPDTLDAVKRFLDEDNPGVQSNDTDTQDKTENILSNDQVSTVVDKGIVNSEDVALSTTKVKKE